MQQFTEGLFDAPARARSVPDTVIATRAMLRGSLTAMQRIDGQLVDASLFHAGGDLVHAEDYLTAAIYLTGQLVTLLSQARQALDSEKAAVAARRAA